MVSKARGGGAAKEADLQRSKSWSLAFPLKVMYLRGAICGCTSSQVGTISSSWSGAPPHSSLLCLAPGLALCSCKSLSPPWLDLLGHRDVLGLSTGTLFL